jgi:hypothetical protein
VILFIALPEAKDNIDPEIIPLHLLPRRCPICQDLSIIGHGQRLRHAHDEQREFVWVRRGLCPPGRKTFTILPDCAYSGARRTAFRAEAEQDSGLIPNTIPG